MMQNDLITDDLLIKIIMEQKINREKGIDNNALYLIDPKIKKDPRTSICSGCLISCNFWIIIQSEKLKRSNQYSELENFIKSIKTIEFRPYSIYGGRGFYKLCGCFCPDCEATMINGEYAIPILMKTAYFKMDKTMRCYEPDEDNDEPIFKKNSVEIKRYSNLSSLCNCCK